ncbi:MAG: hypothetical protein Q8832_02610, partial [Candidatus Phytoplasma australasiaticum]|nr:hypothetical protein [Candidatus Phytoplasma australasiaticum]
KKEEKVRLKGQAALDAKNQAKKPAITKTEMPAVIAESVNEEKQEEPKQIKVPRQKFRAKRKLDFDEEKEEYMCNNPNPGSRFGVTKQSLHR